MEDHQQYYIAELDINNEEVMARYEKALFRAFVPDWSNAIDPLMFIADWKERKLRTRVGYAGQEILAIVRAGAVLGGIAVNYDTDGTLQLELLGFHINRTERFCEALVLFNNGDLSVSGHLLTIGRKRLKERMAARGREIIYGSSDEKKARAYSLIGFTVNDAIDFNGEKELLLSCKIGEW